MENDFTKLEKGAWGGLLGLHGRMMRAIEADLQSRCHISHVEFEILLRLSWAENRRLRIQDIAAQSVLTRSGISRLIERLEGAGLLRREQAAEDKRGAYAILTDAGMGRFHEALGGHIALVRREFLQNYSDDELALIAGFWRRQSFPDADHPS
jgi:DNA-binding MarR family transcriptional regulator